MSIQRPALLSTASTMLAILYGAAKLFVGEYGLLGFNDAVVREIVHFTGYGLLAFLLAAVLGAGVWLPGCSH